MASSQLISTAKATESSLHAALHPLVLLTISDYITRHTLRNLTHPIVGAIIGQQNGREIAIEHAYDVKLVSPAESGGLWRLDEAWFEERLQQYKDVHKAPVLDLVGWWTVSPNRGPGNEVLEIHQQVMKHNESALLLTFHPEAILQGTSVGGKLPLTIYESVYENVKSEDDMKVEGEEGGEKLEVRLKELRYEIATGEAEMISVDFVARGGGNATDINGTENTQAEKAPTGKSKGKEKAAEDGPQKSESTVLNSEEEELISFLTSRANAIKMLHSRISSIKSYLGKVPPSYLTTSNPTNGQPAISHPTLRAILALAAKLPLVVPPDSVGFEQEQAAERSDVTLVKLLADVGRSVQDARELGQKFFVAEHNRKGEKLQPGLPQFDLDPGLGPDAYDGFFEDAWTGDG